MGVPSLIYVKEYEFIFTTKYKLLFLQTKVKKTEAPTI